MKNPNGYGTVVKLKGNRRRPYVVRKTVGWDGDVRIIKAIGYYATRGEAMLALAEYNGSPYDIDAQRITMEKLYERWLKHITESGRLARGTIVNMRSAYNKCKSLHGMAYKDIRAHMMQDCINGSVPSTGGLIRELFINLDKFAAGLDIIGRRYSDLIHATKAEPIKEKTVFSSAEVARLWEHVGEPWVDTILILLYSGWRVSELLNMRVVDIDTRNRTMRGGIKTKAGRGRIVPIHSAIYPLVIRRHGESGVYLIDGGGRPVKYNTYWGLFGGVMRKYGMSHTIHETRHTFRSWLDAANANYACVNRIMGHVCSDVGLHVYTHKTIEDLRATVELIQCEHARQARRGE